MLSSTLPSFSHALNAVGRTNLPSGLFVRRGSFSSVIRVQPGVSGRDTVLTRVPTQLCITFKLKYIRNQTRLLFNVWPGRAGTVCYSGPNSQSIWARPWG